MKNHKLSKQEYQQRYGKTQCADFTKIVSTRNKHNGGWITRRKEAGEDLTSYVEKMGQAVSDAIMADPVERARRAKLLGELNQTDEARKRSSETAKITSARPEIIEARTQNLADWRENDPDAFYEKCISQMLKWRTTRPEKNLREWVQQTFPQLGFRGNQQLRSNEYFLINKSHRRQIDIMSKSHRIIIEFDGYLHFNNVAKWNQLESRRMSDKELNEATPKLGYTLVRVSYDHANNKGEISPEALELVKAAIENHVVSGIPSVVRIGKMYDVEH